MKINKPAQQKEIVPSAPAFAPQAPFLTSKKKESFATWLPLWLCAAFLLFGNLGVQAVNGSESRWLVIAREMFFTGDYLHPTINFEPYFDKPLLTYWFTVFCSLFNGRVVTELTARIPSVLAALAALAAVISIAKRLWDTRTALVAGWIFITFYSFAFWGRLAEADMANEAFSTAAVAWYLAYRGKKSFIGYLVFFLICFIGAHAKGLATIAVPILVVLVDQILNKTIKVHCNWKAFLALAIGVGVYLIPFELSRMIAPAISPATQTVIDGDGTVKTSGIALALRENIIRYFDPFDHKEPFYSYFIHVPRLTLPWSPILILAVYSFTDAANIGPFRSFSVHNYVTLFTTPELLNMILGSVILAVGSGLIATILGTSGAIGAFYSKKRVKTAMSALNQVPVVNADVVTGFSMCILLVVVFGVSKDTYIPLVLGHVVLSAPFVYLAVVPKLKQMDPSIYEAALDLGATPFYALVKVIIPEIASGILSGFVMAITLSLDDYFVATYTKPATFDTISTYVVNATKGSQTEIKTALWALSTIIFLVVVVVELVLNLAPAKKAAGEETEIDE